MVLELREAEQGREGLCSAEELLLSMAEEAPNGALQYYPTPPDPNNLVTLTRTPAP